MPFYGPPDPGGNFATDAHRRVISAVPNADQKGEQATIGYVPNSRQKIKGDVQSMEAILWYVEKDGDAYLDEGQVREILAELEADGDIKKLKDGWVMTAQGVKAATGGIAWPPPHPETGETPPAGRDYWRERREAELAEAELGDEKATS
jgi:hypothetical protein